MSEACSPVLPARSSLFRYGREDVLWVGLFLVQASVLLAWPTIWTIGLGLWWNSNTISHNFIHRPLFRRRGANALFSFALSLVLGFPQSIWRDRHLAHHAQARPRIRPSRLLAAEAVLVAGLWTGLAIASPWFLLTVYLPGFCLGLVLCAVHGHYEHPAGAGTVSHYGWLYNLLFLNDGYHVEHHERPAAHWRSLAPSTKDAAAASPWPPLLRWLPRRPLDTLERLVLRSRLLQRFVLGVHRRAWRRLLRDLPGEDTPRRVGIVGGGLFPRTALILSQELPDAELTIIDGSPESLARGRRRLAEAGLLERVRTVNEWFAAERHGGFDLLVFPLAFRGDKPALRRQLPSPRVVFHDWLWEACDNSRVVSLLLLKRMSLHRR